MANNENEKKLTWLHLSDLHWGNPKVEWDAKPVLDKLKKDLKEMHQKHNLTPDFLFFTGDLVYGELKGNSIVDQFLEMLETLDEIRDCFSPKIPKENVFLVPGNHDVNRTKAFGVLNAWIDSCLKKDYEESRKEVINLLQDQKQDWKQYSQRLEDYRDFLGLGEYQHLLQDPERLIYGVRRNIRDISVGIGGFNSAWSCSRDGEQGRLLLGGEWQAEKIAQQIGQQEEKNFLPEIKIALMHHPLNWFPNLEQSQIRNKLTQHFDFFLHGHEHDSWTSSLDEGKTIRISAGACYGVSEKEKGYNFVTLDLEKGEGRIWLREFESRGGGWVLGRVYEKTDELGRWTIRLSGVPENREFPPEPQKKKEEPTSAEGEMEEETKKRDVSPAVAKGIYGRDGLIETLQGKVQKNKILVLYGLSGIGKSKVIELLLDRLYPAKYEQNRRIKVYEDMGFFAFYRALMVALGFQGSEPPLPLQAFGKINFSGLEKYTRKSSSTLIHVESFHMLLKEGKFIDEDFQELFSFLTQSAPKVRLLLESQVAPVKSILPEQSVLFQKIEGIDEAAMLAFFQAPFRDRPQVSWVLTEDEKKQLYKQLAGTNAKSKVHPLAMNLLAIVAEGLYETPSKVLERHSQAFDKKLEKELFEELYEKVLSEKERSLLQICSLYREGIPFAHVDSFIEKLGGEDVFDKLISRCLIDVGQNEEWYFLHTIIRNLTLRRIEQEKPDLRDEHDLIGRNWLRQLERTKRFIQPNIRATAQAAYHLMEAENFQLLGNLSDDLLRGCGDLVNRLEDWVKKLHEMGKTQDQKFVLEVLIIVHPENHKAHRFLGNALEKLEGLDSPNALMHYKKAYELDSKFLPYLGQIGRNLRAAKKPEEFVTIAESKVEAMLEDQKWNQPLQTYIDCLSEVGKEKEASEIRQQKIDLFSKHTAFYASEANYQIKIGNAREALEILEIAEERKCANDFTLNIKLRVFEQLGQGAEASRLRREQFRLRSKDATFYNDEAQYYLAQEKPEAALQVLQQAEERKCADDHTLSIKSRVLEKLGQGEEASRLRREQIRLGSKDAAFYHDEAQYCLALEKPEEALQFLQQAEEQKCADEVTRSIKTKVLKQLSAKNL